jgi:hypothetical protein
VKWNNNARVTIEWSHNRVAIAVMEIPAGGDGLGVITLCLKVWAVPIVSQHGAY